MWKKRENRKCCHWDWFRHLSKARLKKYFTTQPKNDQTALGKIFDEGYCGERKSK